jgi:SAM-dependent methyltransferase
MNFYESISVYYDEIFPLTQGKWAFAKEDLTPNSTILDIGCSTGTLAQGLATDGFQIHAIDKDPTMVRLARCNHAHTGAHYATMDMMAIDHYFPNDHFDRILCLGNTLVHLPDEQALLRFLRKVKALLKPGGEFRLQMIHYDMIMEKETLGLPTIKTPSLEFTRTYIKRPDGRIDFQTALKLETENQILENSIPLIPLRKGNLEHLLKEAGFKDLQTFGGFDKSPLTEDSVPYVCIAR